jgi:hypothetical protein
MAMFTPEDTKSKKSGGQDNFGFLQGHLAGVCLHFLAEIGPSFLRRKHPAQRLRDEEPLSKAFNAEKLRTGPPGKDTAQAAVNLPSR